MCNFSNNFFCFLHLLLFLSNFPLLYSRFLFCFLLLYNKVLCATLFLLNWHTIKQQGANRNTNQMIPFGIMNKQKWIYVIKNKKKKKKNHRRTKLLRPWNKQHSAPHTHIHTNTGLLIAFTFIFISFIFGKWQTKTKFQFWFISLMKMSFSISNENRVFSFLCEWTKQNNNNIVCLEHIRKHFYTLLIERYFKCDPVH